MKPKTWPSGSWARDGESSRAKAAKVPAQGNEFTAVVGHVLEWFRPAREQLHPLDYYRMYSAQSKNF